MTLLFALTGRRGQGKSTAANYLVKNYNFASTHTFKTGKLMAIELFQGFVGSREQAAEMANGSLKDRPCRQLPGGVAPRFFLEKFGKFMGVDMGVDWTINLELDRAAREYPSKNIVLESLVYESEAVRDRGGLIIRVERLGSEAVNVESDGYQNEIDADYTIRAESVDNLYQEIDRLVFDIESIRHRA